MVSLYDLLVVLLDSVLALKSIDNILTRCNLDGCPSMLTILLFTGSILRDQQRFTGQTIFAQYDSLSSNI